MKLFDYVIGNPPYQSETVGEQKNFGKPVYNYFMDATYDVADVVELITPARFLFNAGGTPKDWNKKMLEDSHFKVLYHEQDGSKVFPNTDIQGGVAITYRDSQKDFGAVEIYTAFEELNSILKKVRSANIEPLSSIIFNRGLYRFSALAYDEQPEEMCKVSDPRIMSSCFERMPSLFLEDKPDEEEYIQIYGLFKAKRCYRWFARKYLKEVPNFEKYKVFIPKSNGSGALGEVLSTPLIGEPLIGEPLIGCTETFICIGNFDTLIEAENSLKYIKSKFSRVMLGVLKITQDNTAEKWKYVPLQDFTPNSDIDWSKSIHEIDLQLYRKYGLDEKEIEFIETHVKEMA